ncbi:MAG: hypothetical protein ACR2OZ_13585 [Verrucomicrobiales bacterium]
MAANLISATAGRWWRHRARLWPLIIFLPALFAGALVHKYAVDVGCWDVWENAALLEKWRSGTLGWSDFYAAQIQHRIVVPRLIIIALHTISGGDFRLENYFTLALILLGGILVYRLICRTLGRSLWSAALALLANLLIFSPLHYQTFFWGSSMWMALPLPCLLLGLAALNSSWPLWARVTVTIICAEIGTHSFAHGLCLWPVLAVYVALQPTAGPWRRRCLAATVVLLTGVVTAWYYFHDFVNQAYHAYNLKPGDPALSGIVAEHPAQIARVFLAFLGALYTRSPWEFSPPMARAPALGAAVLVVFSACALGILLGKNRRLLWPQALPWLAIGAYVIGVGLMIGFGRAHAGEFRAVTPRYLVVSQYFWIAAGVLVFVLAKALLAGRPSWQEVGSRCGVAVIAVAAMAQVPVWEHGLHMTRVWHRAHLQARALILFIDLLPWEQGTGTRNVVDKSQTYARNAIHTLKKLGLFHPPVLTSAELRWFDLQTKPLPSERAAIESAVHMASGQLELTGHARFGAGHPSDLILFAPTTSAPAGQIIGLGQPVATPALRLYALDFEFANAEPLPPSQWHRWRAHIDLSRLPPGESTLEAYALDVEQMSVTRLADAVLVNRPAEAGAVPIFAIKKPR